MIKYDNDYFSNNVFDVQVIAGWEPFAGSHENERILTIALSYTADAFSKIKKYDSPSNGEISVNINRYISVELSNLERDNAINISVLKDDPDFKTNDSVLQLVESYISVLTDIFEKTYGNLFYICTYFRRMTGSKENLYDAYIGLFGEVLFLNHFGEKYANLLISSYHKNDRERIDYNVSNKLDFEIKAKNGTKNEFVLKQHQLEDRLENSFLVTVNLIANPNGEKCSDLLNKMKATYYNLSDVNKARLETVWKLAIAVEGMLKAEKLTFLIDNSHLHCYHINNVPKITQVNPAISNISFTAHLDTDKSASDIEIMRLLDKELEN